MPASTDFNAVCYLQRYPDLRDRATQPAKPGLPLEEQLGWMFWSADGVWKYGRTNNRKLFRIQDDPLWHFENFGIKEGRIGGCDLPGTYYEPVFNAAAYIARYPDVSGVSYNGVKNIYQNDPLGHYLHYGKAQGRIPGYEILTTKDFKGIVKPGTAKFATLEEIIDTQNEYDKKNNSAGSGESVEIIDGENKGSTKTLNYGFLLAAGLGAYFLLRKKK